MKNLAPTKTTPVSKTTRANVGESAPPRSIINSGDSHPVDLPSPGVICLVTERDSVPEEIVVAPDGSFAYAGREYAGVAAPRPVFFPPETFVLPQPHP